MYLPEAFRETDIEAIRETVAAFPLCTLIAHAADGLIANHLPVMLEEERLLGHIARANTLHEQVPDDSAVLAIFQGGDAYVSPNWYPSKPRHHRHVPTWNYRVVHVHGRIRYYRDETSKRRIVARLTRVHEEATNGDQGWRMADAPPDYIESMLDAIVGIEVIVDRIEGKSKLSQNREAEDFSSVAGELDARGHATLASRMRSFED